MRDPGAVCSYLLDVATQAIVSAGVAPVPDRCMVSFGPPVFDMEQLTTHFAQGGLGVPGQPLSQTPSDPCNQLTVMTYVVTLVRPYPVYDEETETFPAVEDEQPVALALYTETAALWNALAAEVQRSLTDVTSPLGIVGATISPIQPLVPEGFYAGTTIELIGT